MGYYVIIAAAVLGLIGQQLFLTWFKPSLEMSVVSAVVQVIATILGIYVLSFVAKSIFKGKAEHDQFFRVAAYGTIVTWLSIIPQISILAALWGLVLTFVLLTTIHKLGTGEAVGTIVIAVILMFVLSLILAPIYAALGFSAFGGSLKAGNNSWLGGKAFDYNIEGDEGSIQFGDGKMRVDTKDGGGTVDFSNGKMKIQTDEGETVEFEIPMPTY